MAEGILIELTGKIIEYLGKLAVEKVVSWWGVKDDLGKLEETMRVIKAVLVDAEKRHAEGKADALSEEWLRRLKKVLYQADDLFDEVFTVHQQTSQSLNEGNQLNQVAKKVLFPFSRSGSIRFNFYVAGEIKSIRKEVDAIKGDLDLNVFNLVATDRGTARLMSKWETASSVNPENIVGREKDKNNIIEMLFSEPNIAEGSISVIPIVGFGGIGKTTLAQLAFNDDGVKKHFNLAKWVWVPEKDSKKEVVRKIFTAFTERDDHGISLERLQSAIRDSIQDKRYLLVLDDVWDESRSSWLDLMDLLGCGKRGSKIIVTTRSFVVAKNIGTIPEPYMMQFLSDEESWHLFQKVALRPGSNPKLIPIGKEIVKKCGNVPLAIKAIGSALYNEDDEIKWRQFKNVQLSKIDQAGSIDIMPALKLSYDRLPSHLKRCFAYCALFQTKGVLYRNFIINKWMAQGFIKPSKEDSNLDLEDVGVQYFEELLSRNFFQDAIQDDVLDNVKFRIHNLMLDLAVHVAGDEYLFRNESLMADGVTKQYHSDLRYVTVFYNSSDSWKARSRFPNARQMRSLDLRAPPEGHCRMLEIKVSNFIRLRSILLDGLMIGSVPNSIGGLRHLRFLTIRRCNIKCLPPSITKLWNLQYLNLRGCNKLAALPTNISRLINLRSLSLKECNLLTETPAGFGELKSLQWLSHFMVGKNNGLDALADMNLRRTLVVDYRRWREDSILEATKANLKGKHRLTKLTLQLVHLDNIPHDAVSLLEELQPPQSLKGMEIVGYQGERLPRWMEGGLSIWLPDLVEFTLGSFKRCRFLSSGFSQLPFLRSLVLSELTALEYVDTREGGFKADKHFPCLEYLKLSKLPQLKGWLRVDPEEEEDHSIDGGGRHEDNEEDDIREKPMFPSLSTLEIDECPELRSMPPAPKLQALKVKDIHESLLSGKEAATTLCSALTISSLSYISLLINDMTCLKNLEVIYCRQLMSITVEAPTFIKHLTTQRCKRLRKIQGLHHLSSTLEYVCVKDRKELDELPSSLGCLTKLQTMIIWKLPRLTALPGSISRLTHLRTLRIGYCPQLTSLPETIGNLSQLRRLVIVECPKMSSYIGSSSFVNLLHRFTLLEALIMDGFPDLTALPVSIGQLPHLFELSIGDCPQLTALPDWFTNLTALQKLRIWRCPHLTSRCKPEGQDWSLIQHIPTVILKDPRDATL